MRGCSLNKYAHPNAAQTLKQLLTQRHSCRAFLADALPQEMIVEMLRIAQRTASWCNTQPWRVFVASGNSTRKLRDALFAAVATRGAKSDLPFPPTYEGPHLERRRASGLQLYAAAGVAKGDREASARQSLRNFEFFDAPHVLVLATPRYLGTYGAVDCGGWIANLLLAAEALGIAAIPQAALATQSEVLRAHFSIPINLDIICGVSFGKEDKASPLNAYRTARADLDEVCEWFND